MGFLKMNRRPFDGFGGFDGFDGFHTHWAHGSVTEDAVRKDLVDIEDDMNAAFALTEITTDLSWQDSSQYEDGPIAQTDSWVL